MRYENLNLLLGEIVTQDGKVDYLRLATRRDLLEQVIREFGERGPDNDAAGFPTDEEKLAYWLNAYNVFTLHTIIQEYPISSVWKIREGQFFQRRRHLAGDKFVSLDDIEHRILRAQFREPAIHFAINCGMNGCPALRPSAYQAEGIHESLRAATEQFLLNQWNCRIDHQTRRIFISRIFKMYAEDFARQHGSTHDYRVGVFRFVSQHTGVSFETIAEYEVLYNVYDWGLNDSHREVRLGPIFFHEPVEHFTDGDRELRELHLYEGNFCNRTCSWCTINGSPNGWYNRYTPAVLDAALSEIAQDGNLKFYGGEPTLHAGEIIEAIRYIRKRGFVGLVTVYSNGVKAERLIEILESDGRSEAVLNYSILEGRDAEPLPSHAKARLESWAADHPGRIFKGYKVLFHAGNGTQLKYDRDREADFHGMGTGCLRCFPVLTTKGRFHACPFAAEIDAPHYDLGRVGLEAGKVSRNYLRFRQWVNETLDPAASHRGVSSCQMCHQFLSELAIPDYEL